MPDSEYKAILDLLAALLFNRRTGVLMLLLAGAAVCDYRSHRIPNGLVLSGAVYAVIINTVLPPWANGNILFPLGGFGLGLLLFLPLYLLRAMGAGDVKLLAMAGAFLGPDDIWRVALATLLAGGVLSVLFVLARGTAARMYHNLTSVFRLGIVEVMSGSAPSLRIETAASAGKLPYGVAIATGTIGFLLLRQLAFL